MIFSIHNWISTKCVPLDILNLRSFYFGLPGNDCTKGTHHKKNEQKHEAVGRLRRPTSCAASVLKYSHFLLGQHKIYTSRVYLTSHVFRSPVMRLFPDQKPDCYYLTALSSTFWRSGCSSYTIWRLLFCRCQQHLLYRAMSSSGRTLQENFHSWPGRCCCWPDFGRNDSRTGSFQNLGETEFQPSSSEYVGHCVAATRAKK